ncbi:hypothetical protein AGABI1DRAFT_115554 [Agaricus bisporus var. burnettii JB137-S8]|uniref:Uncharacterized protein n=1 Tax=Agaricus bisporus var. burnettii (strain JB137-S8 / ATCC MYA-4627 / FGSC 10392) TaxID=597362 RepID=K5X185_AGABU|nr:uncharacterized protein AGABI1DRAFT_115554 [Agaricus bisporus var. burnettii JB137-S8]EKM76898.1 hypothetical protein AGABI1DRAFT_115554 [Agaricus bisporus var. burnettii JB137-S8]
MGLHLADDGLDVAINNLEVNRTSLQKPRALSLPKDVSPLYTGNVSDETVLNFMVDPVVESLGGLDVVSCGKSWEFIQLYKTFTLRPHCVTLLANAGICFGKLILDTTVENWTGIFTVNIRSMLS